MVTMTPITLADYEAWLELWNGYLEFYEANLDEETTATTFARLVDPASGINGALARDDDGAAVGLVHWLMHPATWSAAQYCYLEDLFVAPDVRGGGAGKALISHVREWAEREGCAKTYWLTAESNTIARALYDRVATRSGMIHYQIPLNS